MRIRAPTTKCVLSINALGGGTSVQNPVPGPPRECHGHSILLSSAASCAPCAHSAASTSVMIRLWVPQAIWAAKASGSSKPCCRCCLCWLLLLCGCCVVCSSCCYSCRCCCRRRRRRYCCCGCGCLLLLMMLLLQLLLLPLKKTTVRRLTTPSITSMLWLDDYFMGDVANLEHNQRDRIAEVLRTPQRGAEG